MKTEYVNIKSIKTNPGNPRIIKDEKFAKLVQSIKEFPQMMELRPIVVDADGVILGGNMRHKACISAGMKTVPVVRANDLTDEQKKEFIIKDNVGFGEWDWDMLKDWDTEQLQEWGLDVQFVEDANQLEAEEDDYDTTLPTQPITVIGDLYEIGMHRLLCGDSTDGDAMNRLMNKKKADACITSPPYNQGGAAGDLFSHGKRVESLYQNEFDNKTKKEYFDFCISILNNVSLILNEHHAVIWNVSYNSKSRDDYGKIIFSDLNPFNVKETILWNKGGSINLPKVGIYSRMVEFVFIMSMNDRYLTTQQYGECRWNYWETKRIRQQTDHKATFPIEFANNAITHFTTDDNIIYEPFCGSGTTMVAAHQLNRKCYGMELDPKYCDVIVKRMLNLDQSISVKRNGVDVTSEFKE